MVNDFKNRKQEFALLESLWEKKTAQFAVVYGRRRVGKTALLNRFASNKKIIHWLAYRATSQDLLKDLSQKLHAYFYSGQGVPADFSYGSWQNLFETMALIAEQRKIGIVIDEFPYLVEAEPSLPSLLQAQWDLKLSATGIFFVLSGSRLSMIKDSILSPKAPLYGRATGIINLEPVNLYHLNEFFPKFSAIQQVELYAVTGGVPKYFEFVDKNRPILKSLEQAIKDKTTFLTSEPEFLLHEEFRETRIYLSLLRALGQQRMVLGDLSAKCGISVKNISKYVDDLVTLKLLERQLPVFADPAKARKGYYGICDPFLAFYFRFISPWLQEIEKNRFEQVLQSLRQNFSAYVGKNVFEKICREWLALQADKGLLHFTPERIGAYWDKSVQIDFVAVNHHDQIIMAGECKWTNKPLAAEEMHSLEEKTKYLKSKYDYSIQLAFFSRSGFTPAACDLARKKHHQLFGLQDLFHGK